MIFVFMALVTCAVIAYVAWPLRGKPAVEERDALAPELEIYANQLAQIDADVREGKLMADEAEPTRREVSRRMLAASRRPLRTSGSGAPNNWMQDSRKLALVFAVVALPLIGLTVYLGGGSPDQPGQPAQSSETPEATVANQLADEERALVAKLAAQMEKTPEDPKGWELLGSAYVRLQQFSEAVQAFANAIERGGPNSDRLSSLGEALVFEAGGRVTEEAQYAFLESVKLDADDPRANYFLALSKAQEGDYAAAVESWAALLEKTPEDAPYRAMIESQIKRAGRAMIGQLGETPSSEKPIAPPLNEDVAASASEMTDEERAVMIDGMVSRLSDRLRENPEDLQGWLRLARSYAVLERKEDAIQALDRAAGHFKDDFAAIAEITKLRADLGLPPASQGAD